MENGIKFLKSNIKYLRTLNKETQEELAKVVGKTYTTIGNWESGYRTPDNIDVYNISKHYGVSLDDLFGKDLRFEDQLKTIRETMGDKQLTLPRDSGKWTAGESVSINEYLEYVEELKKENDKLHMIEEMLRGNK